MTERTEFAREVAANLRAARAYGQMSQAVIVSRMQDMGYDTWHRQTLGKIERGERRIFLDELPGLAAALHTNVMALLGIPK